MAPPPPANLPLGQRLAALAQTLQFAWFAGHVTLLLAALRYGLSYMTFNYNSKWAAFSYRTGFVSACVTYGIVVYKAYRARMRAGKQGGVMALATDENVQYLRKFKFTLPSHLTSLLSPSSAPVRSNPPMIRNMKAMVQGALFDSTLTAAS